LKLLNLWKRIIRFISIKIPFNGKDSKENDLKKEVKYEEDFRIFNKDLEFF